MKAQDKILAARYARALFEAARARKMEAKLQNELKKAVQVMEGKDQTLNKFIRHPLPSLSEKKKCVLREMGSAVSPMFTRFLGLMIHKKRMDILPLIYARYVLLAARAGHTVKAHVQSAFPLTASQAAAIEHKLGAVMKKKIIISTEADQGLLGGFVLQIEDKIFDHSWQGRLNHLKETLLSS